jgi:hypothetical protein
MVGHAFIIAMFCMFIWQTTKNEMIFEWFPGWLLKFKWANKIHKPLYDCPICSCFWWGSLIYWITWHGSFVEWILVVFAAGGINTVIIRLLHK